MTATKKNVGPIPRAQSLGKAKQSTYARKKKRGGKKRRDEPSNRRERNGTTGGRPELGGNTWKGNQKKLNL